MALTPTHFWVKRSLCVWVLTMAGLMPSNAQQALVSIDTSAAGYQQVIDGFGTCTYSGTPPSWFNNLYFNDMYCSMVRVDMTPNYISPYSNNSYNSPSYSNAGPDGNYVRTYTGASTSGAQPYTRLYNGNMAQIAVMAAPVSGNINANIAQLQFTGSNMALAGQLAQLGQGSKLGQVGDFKLFGSFWSPPPWVKVSSGNTIGSTFTYGPATGTAFPFIWLGNFAGGLLDVSGTALSQFNNTSALTQYARTVSASLRGFQNYYGVKFYAISIQNELNFEEYYNSCLYQTSAQYITAIEAVRTELNQYPDLAGIQIEGPEDVLGGDQYGMWQYGSGSTATDKNLKFVTNVEANSTSSAALGFYSIHGYDANGVSSNGATTPTSWNWWTNGWTTSPAGIPSPVNGTAHYGKKSWMTETSGETTGWLDSSTGAFPDAGAFSVALKIYQALTAGQESAWVYWQFNDGSNPADVASLTDATNLTLAPKYVAAKHFMRYIRPNSRRVNTTVTGTRSANILATSFLNTGNSTLTIVLINTSSSSTAIPVTVNVPSNPAGITSLNAFTSSNGSYWQGSRLTVVAGQASLSLPAYSVATLTNASIAEAPAVSSPAGNYTSPVTLTVTQPNPGITIYYTTDGTNPTTSSTRQTIISGGTLTISQTTFLQFVVLSDGLYSNVTSYSYTIGSGLSSDTPTLPLWATLTLTLLLIAISIGGLGRRTVT